MTSPLSRRLGTLAIVFVACSVSAFDYSIGRVSRTDLEAREAEHRNIVDGVARTPYRYRVLATAIIQVGVNAVTPFMPAHAGFRRVSAVFHLTALMLMLLVLVRYLSLWFSYEQAIIGVLLVGCTLPITLRHHFYAPYSLLEPTLLTAGLLCIYLGRLRWLPVLTLLASLNRETGVLLPLACLLSAFDDPAARGRRLAFGASCLCLSVGTALLLRWQLGPAESVITLTAVWRTNTSAEGLSSALVDVALFAGGAGWVLAAIGFRRIPPFVRRTAWLAVVYVALYLVWGIWYEVRLLMPLYPVLLPAMLAGLYDLRPSAIDAIPHQRRTAR